MHQQLHLSSDTSDDSSISGGTCPSMEARCTSTGQPRLLKYHDTGRTRCSDNVHALRERLLVLYGIFQVLMQLQAVGSGAIEKHWKQKYENQEGAWTHPAEASLLPSGCRDALAVAIHGLIAITACPSRHNETSRRYDSNLEISESVQCNQE
jgi:hypothetical protein